MTKVRSVRSPHVLLHGSLRTKRRSGPGSVSSDLHWLANQKIAVERYNLAQQPQAFAANEVVKTALKQHGNECLPLILLNGAVVSKGSYPTRDELARLTGVEPDESVQAQPGAQLPVINRPSAASEARHDDRKR